MTCDAMRVEEPPKLGLEIMEFLREGSTNIRRQESERHGQIPETTSQSLFPKSLFPKSLFPKSLFPKGQARASGGRQPPVR